MRAKIVFSVALVSAISLLAGGPAQALTTTAVKINCSKARLQNTINKVAAGAPTTITVKGVCKELIEVPPGKSITLVGDGSSEIAPPNSASSSTLLTIGGSLTLQRMKITNAGASQTLISALGNSSLYIYGSTLAGASVSTLLDVSEGSAAKIFNSVIDGGTKEAFSVSSRSSLEVYGTPSALTHFNPSVGDQTIITTPAWNGGLQCEQNGSVVVGADGSGKVEVRDSVGAAVQLSQCSFTLNNTAQYEASVILDGEGASINSVLSTLSVSRTGLISRNGYCFVLDQSNAIMTGLEFGICNAGQSTLVQSFLNGNFQP